VSTIEELLGRKTSGSNLENLEYGRKNPYLYPQKLVLTLPTSGGFSVGIVRSLTKATEFFLHMPHAGFMLGLFMYPED
jgi:hypothetical protein